MADYQTYLNYLKHVDDETEKIHQLKENSIREEMEKQIDVIIEKCNTTLKEKENLIKETIKNCNSKIDILQEKHRKELDDVMSQYQEYKQSSDEKIKALRKESKQISENSELTLSQAQETFATERADLMGRIEEAQKEISKLKTQHRKEIEKLKTQHQSEIEELRANTVKDYDDYQNRIQKLNERHATELSDVTATVELELNAKYKDFKKEVAERVKKLNEEISSLKNQNSVKDNEISQLKAQINKKKSIFDLFRREV